MEADCAPSFHQEQHRLNLGEPSARDGHAFLVESVDLAFIRSRRCGQYIRTRYFAGVHGRDSSLLTLALIFKEASTSSLSMPRQGRPRKGRRRCYFTRLSRWKMKDTSFKCVIIGSSNLVCGFIWNDLVGKYRNATDVVFFAQSASRPIADTQDAKQIGPREGGLWRLCGLLDQVHSIKLFGRCRCRCIVVVIIITPVQNIIIQQGGQRSYRMVPFLNLFHPWQCVSTIIAFAWTLLPPPP